MAHADVSARAGAAAPGHDAAKDSDASVTVETLIDTAPIGSFQIMVFALCILASVLDGFDTQAIAFVAPAISSEWAVSQWQFGFVFSATLMGSVIGAGAFGVLADRIGRRWLVIATTAMFGLFSAACALATSYEQLLLFRFLGGLGMGGLVPNMLALSAEYAPRRLRARIVTLVLWGFPLGAVIGGMISAPLLEAAGWRIVFWLGAAAPLLLAVAMIFLLPESLRFLNLDSEKRRQVIALVRKIAPARADSVNTDAPAVVEVKASFVTLFRGDLAFPTALLAITMFLSLFLAYSLINWIPTLLTQSGLSMADAIFGAVALNLGGIIGSYFFSQGVDRVARPPLLLAGGYAVAAVMIAITGAGSQIAWLALTMLLLCGVFLIGTQLSVTAFATAAFPVQLRGTGIGFIQAVGRTGSLIGPVVGGLLLSLGFRSNQLLQLSALPALLCAVALLILGLARQRPTDQVEN